MWVRYAAHDLWVQLSIPLKTRGLTAGLLQSHTFGGAEVCGFYFHFFLRFLLELLTTDVWHVLQHDNISFKSLLDYHLYSRGK